MTSFVVGDVAQLFVTVRDAAGALADPTAIALTLKLPAGTPASLPVTRESVGSYYSDYSILLAGSYAYRWEATGTNQGVAQGSFVVQGSLV
jgi:hypothetical protein